jgi:hypothetical protein
MNCVNAHIASDMCNFRFILWDDAGFGWAPEDGIGITVDGIDYGFVNLPFGTPSTEVIVSLPSGEVQLFWIGILAFHRQNFEVYNPSDSLIYKSPEYMDEGLFLTYLNECPPNTECLPITDFEGVYIIEIHRVNLSWTAPESTALLGFDIFRNDSLIDHITSITIVYSDNTEELENGDYKYCVVPVYPYECTLDENCFNMNIHVGIKDYASSMQLYPNPANNIVNITGDNIANIQVFNCMGQLMNNYYNVNSVNVSSYKEGIYIFNITTIQGDARVFKIVVNK